MTRDEILAMEPGRELDALVAEKVMGWTKFSPIDPKIDYGVGVNGYRRNYAKDPEGRLTWFPFYSTDISAAWEMESIFNQDSEIRGTYVNALANVVCANLGVTPLDDYWSLIHASPAERCKAALLALEESQ